MLAEAIQRGGRPAAWGLFSRIANLAFLVTGGLAAVLAVFALPVVRAELGVAPGFDEPLQELVADLMRLNLIATLIFSISGLVIAGLQAQQHFLLPAMAPVMYDLGQIFGALVLAPETGYRLGGLTLPAAGLGVHGLVYGVILGAALHLAVQLPGLIRYGFRWAPRLGLGEPAVRKVLGMMGPRILTIGGFQLIFVIQDNLASRLDVGSVTALTYGWLIMQVPETILATAIGTALLPTLSEHFARQDRALFGQTLARAGRVLVALTLPTAVLLMVCIQPWVQLAFDFDARGTALVAGAARAFLVGLVGHSLLELAARAFYARQNARVPMFAALIGATAFTLLSVALFRPLAASGIALANSLAFTLQAGVLLALLARRGMGALGFGRPLLRAAAGAAAAGLVAGAALAFTPGPLWAGAALSLGLGGLALLPFILPELRELQRL